MGVARAFSDICTQGRMRMDMCSWARPPREMSRLLPTFWHAGTQTRCGVIVEVSSEPHVCVYLLFHTLVESVHLIR